MQEIERVVGLAGCGKTRYVVEQIEASGLGPEEVALTSFTRAARVELAARCGDIFGVGPRWLTRQGHFRTAHSTCWRAIGGTAEAICPSGQELPEWLARHGNIGVHEDAEIVLNCWSAARNANRPVIGYLRSLQVNCDQFTLQNALPIIAAYELAKLRTGTLDYTDALGKFAGVKWAEDGTWIEGFAHGEPPLGIRLAIVDEAQDASALIYRVQRRCHEGVPRVIIAGDGFQSIYSFLGGSPKFFFEWEGVTKETVLSKTWRCPSVIWDRAMRTLRRNSEWHDYGVQPRDTGGSVLHAGDIRSAVARIRSTDGTVLALGRTRNAVNEIRDELERTDTPYDHVEQMSTTQVGREAYYTLWQLSEGKVVPAGQFLRGLDRIPATHLLQRNAKARWKDGRIQVDALHPEWLVQCGFSEKGAAAIRDGSWKQILAGTRGFQRWEKARRLYGAEAATKPRVRLSTVHGAKGLEADTVLISDRSTELVNANLKHRWSADEERRVVYVALTRARERVLVARTNGRWRFQT